MHGFDQRVSKNKGRPLDFLLQIDLATASEFDKSNLLPKTGLLSFFYDMEDQPWGYDPNDLNGYKVVYSPSKTELQKWNITNEDYRLGEFELIFRSGLTVPHSGSRNFEVFEQEADLDGEESDSYWDFATDAELVNSDHEHSNRGRHRLLGHSENIQGDMQLEAQLVTNGLYCGDASGYKDARRADLEKGVDDWILLLQLDSDDMGNFMWGDCGMLYYWIKKQDLAELRFDNVWMTLQCS